MYVFQALLHYSNVSFVNKCPIDHILGLNATLEPIVGDQTHFYQINFVK